MKRSTKKDLLSIRADIKVVFADGARVCRACGCTDQDCRACIQRTGKPCHWVEAELCSVCAERGYRYEIRVRYGGNTNVASARIGGRTLRASSTASGRQACLDLAQKAAASVRADSAKVERFRAFSPRADSAVLYMTFKTGGAA